LREQRRADANEDIGTQSRRLARVLALDADGAPEERRQQELGEDAEPKRIRDGFDRGGRSGCSGLEENRGGPVVVRGNLPECPLYATC